MPKCRFCEEFVPLDADRCPCCGAQTTKPDTDWEQDVRSLVEEGRKIEAIKVYRAHTGLGLAEAKAAVEAIQVGASPPPMPELGGDLEADLLRLLGQGEKIQAIKLYRAQTGMGLAEAKQAVEALAARHGLSARQAGCLGVLLAATVAAFVIGMMVW